MNIDIQREKILARPEVGIPALVKETIDGSFIKEDLQNYFEDDTESLLNILKQQNIWIAGGYILKNFLKDLPNYREEFWSNSDIDFWGVTDDQGIHEDPFCPLRKILKKRGYTSKIVATQARLELISADYSRLSRFVSLIQEWVKIDNESQTIHKIQLILLNNYNNFLSISKNLFSRLYRNRLDAGMDVSNFNIDQEAKDENLIYKNRNTEDFLTDAVLSFDLTCCQVAYHLISDNNGIVTWFGTTNSDEMKNEIVDYPDNTPIIQNIERYLTKIGSQAFKQQSIMEWLRTLKRSMKYSQRGFRIVNWMEIERFIVEEFLSQNQPLNNEFIRNWNPIVYGFRFYKYAQFIPIWLVDDNHQLFVFNLQNRKPVLQTTNQNLSSNLNKRIIQELADKEVDQPLSKELLIRLTGTTNFYISYFPEVYKDLKWESEIFDDIPLSNIEYSFLKDQDFKDEEKIEIDELKLLEESQPQCFDIIESEEFNNKEFVEADEDNILLIRKQGDNYQIDCYRRQLLEDIINDPTRGKYACNMILSDGRPIPDSPFFIGNLVDENNIYYRIDTSFGRIYLLKDDILKMIHSNNKIFYIDQDQSLDFERSASVDVLENEIAMSQAAQQGRVFHNPGYIISADHCQQGTDIKVYRIKVCGGLNCLKIALEEKTWLDNPI
jgi:hypothetical protein